MNWLHFFDTKLPPLQHPFGRGINASLRKDEEELFDKSYEAFEKKEILQAYKYFFDSLENLSNNISNNNISSHFEGEKLLFEIYQGCAKVSGTITQDHLYAEAIIIKNSSANVAIKRYILNRNYQLTYACYFSDDEYIKLKIYHDNITMSPQKIFFPLREISLNADFDKEFMQNEFDNVAIEDTSHITPLDADELKIKYTFMQESIEQMDAKIETLPSNDNAGMQAFLILNTLYMFDYLLVPKNKMYQQISKKIQEYFTEENGSLEAKNDELRLYVETLKKLSFEEFASNFYNAKYTFNPTEKTTKEDVDSFINESLLKIRWYKNNRYKQIIPTIYKYIAFYMLYNYGLNPVVKDLLHILVNIQNSEFFTSLGYTQLYNEEKNSFAKKSIITHIENIIEPHKARFKHLQAFGEELNFSSLNEFSNSFYLQIQNLNFEEI